MAIHYHKGATALVLGIGLAATTALADEGRQGSIGQSEDQPGAVPGQAQQQQGQACPSCVQQGAQGWSPSISGGQAQQQYGQQGFGQQGYGQQQQGFGAGVPGQQQQSASIGVAAPQFWIADAALFIGNAANTAHVLTQEQGLNAQAPQVLGNQAQFLVAAVNRALTSLIALQQSAESANPGAVPEIRGAVANLVAAQAQAGQVADAANAGIAGPTLDTTLRATMAHLTAAERSMASVGRAYGAPQLALAGTCPTRAFGAGLGAPKRGGPGQTQQPQQQQPQQPKQQQQQQDQQKGGTDQQP